MLFTAPVFLFAFLPLVLLVHAAAPQRVRNSVLLAASYVFYGWWRVDFLALVMGSTVIDYLCAARIHAEREGAGRKSRMRAWLWVSLTANLGVLGFFKYAALGLQALDWALATGGADPTRASLPDIVLPLGISFYTLQTLSYTIDVYRGAQRPARSLVDFACYVSLFPQLVAGPIVRFGELREQLAMRRVTWSGVASGAFRFQIGFVKKVLVADVLAEYVDPVIAGGALGFAEAWCALLMFTLQLYYDFSGYCDMALGIGSMLGFRLTENFRSPLRAESLGDLWRRWHVSLSTWVRDYLYTPLGGSRGSRARQLVVLLACLGLSGLWHGAAPRFLVWGLLHGVLLWLERARAWRAVASRVPRPGRVAVTFLLFVVTLVPFRWPSLGASARTWASMFDGSAELFLQRVPSADEWAVFALGLSLVFFAPNSIALTQRPRWPVTLGVALAFAIAVAESFARAHQPFLYFQF